MDQNLIKQFDNLITIIPSWIAYLGICSMMERNLPKPS